MLSTPCWFIKLIPAQEEADLHTDHRADGELWGILARRKQRSFLPTLTESSSEEQRLKRSWKIHRARQDMWETHKVGHCPGIGRINWQILQQEVAGRHTGGGSLKEPSFGLVTDFPKLAVM